MSSIPPLSVKVSTRRVACVLDTDLALSRFGLLLILRLREEFDLWLVPELWRILDETEIVRSHLLSMDFSDSPRSKDFHRLKRGFLGDILLDHHIAYQWETARIETDIAGLNIYWVGDEKSESLLPKDLGYNLMHRFKTLSESLDEKIPNLKTATYPDLLLNESYRDTAALVAALTPFRGFILVRQEVSHERKRRDLLEPTICSYLRTWKIPCHQITLNKKTRIEQEFLLPILARTGISELMWAGLHLAVVHLVAPKAAFIPVTVKEADSYQQSDDKPTNDWWRDAALFWYPLTFN